MPTFDFKLLIAFGLSCALSVNSLSACWVQEDNPFGAAPAAGPGDKSPAGDSSIPLIRPEFSLALPESNRLIIRAVYDANPQTAEELAKAVKTMMDIEAFDHAKYLLGKLQGIPPTDQEMYEMQATVGPDFFLALHGSPPMQPQGREFATAVFAAAKRTAYDPKRVESLVNTISNENVSARSEAFRMLRRLVAPGAAALLNVFTQPERSKEFPFIRGALTSFGVQAIGPLVGGARANNLQMQVESVRALGYYKSSEAADAMLRVYLSPQFPESVRRSALDSMMTQYGRRGDPAAAEDQLYQHAEDYLLGRRKLPNSAEGLATIWRWNPTTKQLESRTLPKITAERISAADRAADLFEINPAGERNRSMYLLTRLEAAKREAGPSREIDVKEALLPFGTRES